MENVIERLPSDIRENTSSITTHPQNLSGSHSAQRAMILRVFRALQASLHAQIAKYNADTSPTVDVGLSF